MKPYERLLYATAWIGLILSVGLLLNKVFLDSDSLFLESLMTDIFQHGGSWTDWRFPPAPAYVPDVLLYFLGYFLFPTASLRIFFVSACQALMLAPAALWLARTIRPDLSATARAAIVALVAATTIVSARSGMWLYFYSTNNHFSTLLFGLLALGFGLQFLERQDARSAILLVLCVGAAQISSTLFAIAFIVPVALALAAVLLVSLHANSPLAPFRKRIGVAIALIVAGYELALLIDRLVTFNEPGASRVSLNPELAARSLKLIMRAAAIAFAPDNAATLLFSLLIVASYGFLVFHFLRGVKIETTHANEISFRLGRVSDWRLAAGGLALAFIAPVDVFGSILSGGVVDLYGFRYFILPIALALLLAVVAIDKHASSGPAARSFGLSVFIVAVACVVVSAATMNVGEWRRSATQGHFAHNGDQIAACLADLRAHDVDVKSGLADYFYARGVEYLLPPDQSMLSVIDSMIPEFWMTTFAPLAHPERYPLRRYNFVVVRDVTDPADVTVIDLGKVGKILPPGFTTYPCPAAQAQILFYPSNRLDDAFARYRQFLLFSMQETNEVAFSPLDLTGSTGRLQEGVRIAEAPGDAAGFLTLGPYRDLHAGRYRIALAYSARTSSEAPANRWDIGRFDSPSSNLTLYKDELQPGDGRVAEAIVDVPAAGLKAMQIRVWFSGHGRLEVKSLTLTRVSP